MAGPNLEPGYVRETERGHKSSQSSGGSYQTASPEQKQIEWSLAPEQPQGLQVPAHGRGGRPHLQGQELQAQMVSVPPPARDGYDIRPVDMYTIING